LYNVGRSKKKGKSMDALKDLILTMKRIQGERNAADMAASMGITLTMLNYIYAGERKPGVRVLRALLQTYPETEPYIIDYIRHGEGPPSQWVP
jgi:transcriptional regulator with XRE-family HTH domain